MCLKNRFPSSSRVQKLHALCYEAIGKHDIASDIYDQLIKDDSTKMVVICNMVENLFFRWFAENEKLLY